MLSKIRRLPSFWMSRRYGLTPALAGHPVVVRKEPGVQVAQQLR